LGKADKMAAIRIAGILLANTESKLKMVLHVQNALSLSAEASAKVGGRAPLSGASTFQTLEKYSKP